MVHFIYKLDTIHCEELIGNLIITVQYIEGEAFLSWMKPRIPYHNQSLQCHLFINKEKFGLIMIMILESLGSIQEN